MAFGVTCDGEGGRVVVTEHEVEFAVGSRRAAVPAGWGASYRAAGPGKVAAADGASELSWRDGRLTFVQAPLGRVVAEINRRREGRLVMVGGALAARPVTLIVDIKRLETKAARVDVVGDAGVVREARSKGAVGVMTPAEAIRRNTDGTGAAYRFTDATTVALQAPDIAPMQQEGPTHSAPNAVRRYPTRR